MRSALKRVRGHCHRRPPARPPVRAYLMTSAALLSAVLGVTGLIAAGAQAAPDASVTHLTTTRAAAVRAAVTASGAASTLRMTSTQIAAQAAAAAKAAHAAMLAALPRYTVKTGDTLTLVAQRTCQAGRDWTGIYSVSRELRLTAANANILSAGQHLAISCTYLASALKAAPAIIPPAPRRILATVTSASRGTYRPAYSSSGGSSGRPEHAAAYSGSGSFQKCVIARESGGNSQVMNSSGHYGLYQFSASTWAAFGGFSADFGHASVAEQNRVFSNAVAADGGSDWTPYDGCAYTSAKVAPARGSDGASAPVTLDASVTTLGDRLLNAAETRAGDWYSWGADGPGYFDCSGLVYWAGHQVGVNLPRDTYGLLASAGIHLERVSVPRRGDLAFFGTGHVEIMTAWSRTTFGAQTSGTRVGWHKWNSYWHPTAFYRVIG